MGGGEPQLCQSSRRVRFSVSALTATLSLSNTSCGDIPSTSTRRRRPDDGFCGRASCSCARRTLRVCVVWGAGTSTEELEESGRPGVGRWLGSVLAGAEKGQGRSKDGWKTDGCEGAHGWSKPDEGGGKGQLIMHLASCVGRQPTSPLLDPRNHGGHHLQPPQDMHLNPHFPTHLPTQPATPL
eukprot:361747-Chlamydomonas_euryale.AAC.6